MNKIKFLNFSALYFIALSSCAQQKEIAKVICATYYVSVPGNMPLHTDEEISFNSDTINIIYIETSAKKINWIMAWKNDKNFSIISSQINKTNYNAGIRKTNHQKIVVNAGKRKILWQLSLSPEDKINTAPVNMKPGEIILNGVLDGKNILLKIPNSIQINSYPFVL